MIRLRPNPDRLENLARIKGMDPQRDAWQIHRITVRDFPGEMKIGHRVAFLHTYAAPSIAELLAATGHLTHDTYHRALDTYLYIFEFIEGGLDSPRSRELLRSLNQMHRVHTISQDDYLYVLATFSVLPTRLIQQHGWRPISDAEIAATHRFYADLGRRMGIRDIPATYSEMAAYLDHYEASRFQTNEAGHTLMRALIVVLTEGKSPAQGLLRRWTISYLLGDRAREPIGLPRPPAAGRAALRIMFKLRAAAQRRQPAPVDPWFVPGSPQTKIYPSGYSPGDLGVHQTYLADEE